MKRPAATAAAAPKRELTSAEESEPKHARTVPDRLPQNKNSLAGDDVSELRRGQARIEEELREAKAEQTTQKSKLKQAEKDAKDAREALARLDSAVAEKRSAFTELTQQVSAAVRAKGVTKLSVALGAPVFYTAGDICFCEDFGDGDFACRISVVVQAECFQVAQCGKSAKVIRYERSSKASEVNEDVQRELKEPKKPHSAYFIWLDDNRDALAKEAGTNNASVISKLARQKWKVLGDAAVQIYHQRATEEKAAYEEAMEEFLKAGGVKNSGKASRKEKQRPQISDFLVSCNHICEESDASGSVVCTTMAGGEVGRFAVPRGEDAFGMWLPGNVLQSVCVPKKCRLRLVNLQGDVFWTQADDAVRPLVSSMQQLDRLKKQHDKEGHIVAATEQAVMKRLSQALNFGDDACLGHILLGSHSYEDLSSPMPSSGFLKRYLKPERQDDLDGCEGLKFLKAKLVRGLGLDKLVSNFLTRQCQRGCQTITVRYIGDKKVRKRESGLSQRKMLISGCSPLEEASSSASRNQLEEVMVIDVDFDFDCEIVDF